jgi:hypothetical protein
LQIPALARTWIDTRGNRFDGDLVTFASGRVIVRGERGRMMQLAWSDLSPNDQAFIAFAAEASQPGNDWQPEVELLPRPTRGVSTRDSRTIVRGSRVDEEVAGLTARRTITHSLPAPSLRIVQQPAPAPAPPATIEDSAACCYPKYIYCGHKGTFHIVGDAGMGTYTIGCDQWLARLVPMTPNHPHRDLYFRPVCDDPLTDGWAFSTVPNCHGHYAIYRLVRGRWCLFDSATRVVPN